MIGALIMVNKLEQDILILIDQGEMSTTQLSRAMNRKIETVRSALKRLMNKNKIFVQSRFGNKTSENWYSLKPVEEKKKIKLTVLNKRWV